MVQLRRQRRARDRAIGPIGTAARLAIGLWLAGSVVIGQAANGFVPASWLLGLVAFPAVAFAWHAWHASRTSRGFRLGGVVGHVTTLVVFLALWLTPYYAPAFAVTSDAVLLFYGGSMLLEAALGYAGCEVLALSNWLLRRQDELGCVLFAPVDHLERRALQAEP